jgi:hypothetical protein
MWKEYLWNHTPPFSPPQRVWKSKKLSTGGCGKKVLVNTGLAAVFHITFPYHC